MPPFTVEALKETLETLSSPDLRLLQNFIAGKLAEDKPAPPSEDEARRILFERGVLTHLRPPITDFTPWEDRKLIEIEGEPLSETIMRERR